MLTIYNELKMQDNVTYNWLLWNYLEQGLDITPFRGYLRQCDSDVLTLLHEQYMAGNNLYEVTDWSIHSAKILKEYILSVKVVDTTLEDMNKERILRRQFELYCKHFNSDYDTLRPLIVAYQHDLHAMEIAICIHLSYGDFITNEYGYSSYQLPVFIKSMYLDTELYQTYIDKYHRDYSSRYTEKHMKKTKLAVFETFSRKDSQCYNMLTPELMNMLDDLPLNLVMKLLYACVYSKDFVLYLLMDLPAKQLFSIVNMEYETYCMDINNKNRLLYLWEYLLKGDD